MNIRMYVCMYAHNKCCNLKLWIQNKITSNQRSSILYLIWEYTSFSANHYSLRLRKSSFWNRQVMTGIHYQIYHSRKQFNLHSSDTAHVSFPREQAQNTIRGSEYRLYVNIKFWHRHTEIQLKINSKNKRFQNIREMTFFNYKII